MNKNQIKAAGIGLGIALATLAVWMLPWIYYWMIYRCVNPGGAIGIRI